MDIKQIQDLIRFVSKSGVNEVSIEQENFKITIKTNHGTGSSRRTCRRHIKVCDDNVTDDRYVLQVGKPGKTNIC